VASEWLRHAVAPIAAACRWERRHYDGAERLSGADLEAILLLALPLAELPDDASGACALAGLLPACPNGSGREVAGVTVEVWRGRVVSCAPGGGGEETRVLGTADAWLDAVSDGRAEALRPGGPEPRLAESIVTALRGGGAERESATLRTRA
jgi:hypothetical protein